MPRGKPLRNANGYGSVVKLSGKRRKPFEVEKPILKAQYTALNLPMAIAAHYMSALTANYGRMTFGASLGR